MKKLRNKNTGEIGVIKTFNLSPDDEVGEIAVQCSGCTYYYDNLSELCEKWEDYEEPDVFYYIDADGYIKSHLVDDKDFNNVKDGVENLIAIGNWFETGEKARKAVEKLEARGRLLRKGFKFTGYNLMNGRITFTFDGPYYGGEEDRKIPISDDLYVLFGGEE